MNTPTNSKALTKHIRQALTAAGGSLSFADFMEMALYHPKWGYYQHHSIDIGKQGDFTTAPEISPLFTQCLARQCAALFQQLPNAILELGAGTGRLACDLLLALHGQGIAIEHYYIVEISRALRKKQKAFMAAHCPHLVKHVTWLDKLPTDFAGIILANEVLDALPVHCFRIEDTIKERCVVWRDNQFAWQTTTPSTELNNEVTRLRDTLGFAQGYESEINLNLNTFITELAQCLSQGVILLIDYGYGEREYYHPERRQGTLTCFYQHRRYDDPLQFPGAEDITAHVNFTRVIEIAAANHCTLLGYTSQAAFLLACGLMELAEALEKQLSVADQVHLHHAIKLLTFPTEMGERVKVMALGKNVADILPDILLGFTLQDRRRDL